MRAQVPWLCRGSSTGFSPNSPSNSKLFLYHITPASLAQPLLLFYSWGRWSGSLTAFTEQMHVVHKHIVNKCGLDLAPETSHFTHWLEDMSQCTSVFIPAPMLGAIFGIIGGNPIRKDKQWRLFHGSDLTIKFLILEQLTLVGTGLRSRATRQISEDVLVVGEGEGKPSEHC